MGDAEEGCGEEGVGGLEGWEVVWEVRGMLGWKVGWGGSCGFFGGKGVGGGGPCLRNLPLIAGILAFKRSTSEDPPYAGGRFLEKPPAIMPIPVEHLQTHSKGPEKGKRVKCIAGTKATAEKFTIICIR